MTYEADIIDLPTAEPRQLTATASGDITDHLSQAQVAQIGADVVRDWEMDKAGNKEWRDKAQAALDSASQEASEARTYPFPVGSANVKYPLLTISALAFQSRAAPAIMKGDEAVKVKTFGKDRRGEKQAKATRMADYLNWKLFYDIDGWEQDTDAMLLRLPAVGQHYRKVWWDAATKKPCIESISALRLTIPSDARTLKASPRITHDFDRYPYELRQMMARGEYRDVDLVPQGEDDQAPRVILEQHRMIDLDEDGLDEPYIVTVDEQTAEVLRIEEAFDDDGIKTDESTGQVVKIDRWCPFVDYSFIPDPKGRAYSIGFGYLLAPLMAVIDTIINMELDAGQAQVAGGGFISAEVRLQSAGKNGGNLRFQPGEYKTVSATAMDLKNAIYERTFPEPSPVLFQLLGMLMEAAKDIASVNDSITGDAARTAPVGTTLALIEQGQQVFNGIYKRVYRALREEFRLLAECIAKYGGDEAAKEYADFCDLDAPPQMLGHNGGPPMGAQPGGEAPEAPQGMIQQGQTGQPPVDPLALFHSDFGALGPSKIDIRPVSDPSAVTKSQVIAKGQMSASFLGKGIYADDRLVVRQILTDAGIEQADQWIPDQPPAAPPNPIQLQGMALEFADKEADATKKHADAQLSLAKAAQIAHESTGPEADIKLAKDHSTTTLNLTKAAHLAASLHPDETPETPA